MADMLFSFLFAEILRRLKQRFARANLSLALPWRQDWMCAPPGQSSSSTADAQVRPIDVTWMDDLALLVTDDPEALIAKTRAVASAVIAECVQATLLPNLAEGKTEAAVDLRGPKSRRLRASIFRGMQPSVPLESPIWPEARLRLIACYKHGGGTAMELTARTAAAWQAFRQRRKQIFMSPVVSHKDKAILFSSLVESTYYGIGTWPGDMTEVERRLQSTLVGMSRLMLRPTFTIEAARHIRALYALAVVRILPAAPALHLERLRHFRVVVGKANE